MKQNNNIWLLVTDEYKRYAIEKRLNKYNPVNAMPDLSHREEMTTKRQQACILSDDVCDEMDKWNHDEGEAAI